MAPAEDQVHLPALRHPARVGVPQAAVQQAGVGPRPERRERHLHVHGERLHPRGQGCGGAGGCSRVPGRCSPQRPGGPRSHPCLPGPEGRRLPAGSGAWPVLPRPPWRPRWASAARARQERAASGSPSVAGSVRGDARSAALLGSRRVNLNASNSPGNGGNSVATLHRPAGSSRARVRGHSRLTDAAAPPSAPRWGCAGPAGPEGGAVTGTRCPAWRDAGPPLSLPSWGSPLRTSTLASAGGRQAGGSRPGRGTDGRLSPKRPRPQEGLSGCPPSRPLGAWLAPAASPPETAAAGHPLGAPRSGSQAAAGPSGCRPCALPIPVVPPLPRPGPAAAGLGAGRERGSFLEDIRDRGGSGVTTREVLGPLARLPPQMGQKRDRACGALPLAAPPPVPHPPAGPAPPLPLGTAGLCPPPSVRRLSGAQAAAHCASLPRWRATSAAATSSCCRPPPTCTAPTGT